MVKPTPMNPGGIGAYAKTLPIGSDPASIRKRVVALERLLERSFVIPGTNQPFGLDVILNAVPVLGSFIGAGLSSYMIWEARNLGMSKLAMSRMAGNVAIDWALGAIPLIGAIPDFFFRSNTRNLRIIKKHLDKHHPATVTIDG